MLRPEVKHLGQAPSAFLRQTVDQDAADMEGHGGTRLARKTWVLTWKHGWIMSISWDVDGISLCIFNGIRWDVWWLPHGNWLVCELENHHFKVVNHWTTWAIYHRYIELLEVTNKIKGLKKPTLGIDKKKPKSKTRGLDKQWMDIYRQSTGFYMWFVMFLSWYTSHQASYTRSTYATPHGYFTIYTFIWYLQGFFRVSLGFL